MVIDDKKLKHILKSKGLTKSSLCDKLGISSRTIAKIGKGEDINDKIVSNILSFLEASVDDVVAVNNVLHALAEQKEHRLSGGLYHETQIKLTYNSNHIEGSKLTEDQTRYIFETKPLGSCQQTFNLTT